jgi:hypothetical protein
LEPRRSVVEDEATAVELTVPGADAADADVAEATVAEAGTTAVPGTDAACAVGAQVSSDASAAAGTTDAARTCRRVVVTDSPLLRAAQRRNDKA